MTTPKEPHSHEYPGPDQARRDAAWHYLLDRVDFERVHSVDYQHREFKLDRMRDLAARLGDPQTRFPIIHIAGSKGKGSTAAMIGAILTAAGYRVGAFTSPHLDRIEERISIDAQPCSTAELADLVEELQPTIAAMDQLSPQEASAQTDSETGPTFFEITTAMALLHFLHREVDVAILEVGLGGRLDSTNICRPIVSVITSIGFDHMQQLGNTLASIAREKGGIIKDGIPIVSGVVDEEPRNVIRRLARERDCRLIELDTDFSFTHKPARHLERRPSMASVGVQWAHEKPNEGVSTGEYALNLPGRHQGANAAVAVAVIEELRRGEWRITDRAVRDGLSKMQCRARVEVVSRHPAVVLDVAHNEASIGALIDCLRDSFSVKRRFLIFAATADKNVSGMLKRLMGEFDEIILTCYTSNPRGMPAEELAALASQVAGRPMQAYADAREAWQTIRARASVDDLICITGSFFIAAEMRRFVAEAASSD